MFLFKKFKLEFNMMKNIFGIGMDLVKPNKHVLWGAFLFAITAGPVSATNDNVNRNEISTFIEKQIGSVLGRKVTGQVLDKAGEPIIGANVRVKGSTTNGTITDLDGKFVLEDVEENAILVISYIGYLTTEVSTTGKTTVQVTMSEDSKALDEVVVVGYGVQKKVNLTGSVESVNGDNIAKRSTIQTTQAIQGMVPGMTVTTNSGRPGKEGATIRIRGIGTLNDNNPLVLVDGVESSLDAVDPNDIENISVLKDAASAAIYGSRAANGVILITTKRGTSQDVKVTYKGTVGFSSPVYLPEMSNAWDYMTLMDEGYANDNRKADGTPGGYMYGPDLIKTWKEATDRDAYPNSNAVKETFKERALQTQHYLNFAVGSDKFKTNTSVNYSYQESLIPNSDYQRYGIRSNNDYIVSDKLSVGFDLSVRNTHNFDAAYSGSVMENLLRNPAIYATRYSNGVWGAGYAGDGKDMSIRNIFEKLTTQEEEWSEISARLKATYKPFEGAQLDVWYAPKVNNYSMKQLRKTMPLYDYKTLEVIYEPSYPATITEQRDKTTMHDFNILATYNKTVNKHDFSVLGGYQMLVSDYNKLTAYREGNPFQNFEEINIFDPLNMTNSGTRTQWALMSYFGRLNYAYDGKYLFEANVRYDGSSRFAEGHRWGLFPSFSAAWRFQAEEFMKDITWLSNGKLRASWGELGNQAGLGSDYPFALLIETNQYQVFDGEMAPGYAPVNYAMTDISWETTRMMNFGIDLGFLNGKIDVSFDWYKKKTYDILLNMPIPSVMGYNNSPKQNAGIVENKGWDLSITHTNQIGDFYYRVRGVLSDVRNKIVDIGSQPVYNSIYIQQNGSPINSIYGYVADGLFSSFEEAQNHPYSQWGSLQGGDIKYLNLDDSNDKIDTNDRIVIGNTIPRFTYSLDLMGSYKGFDLSLFFQGVGKRDGYVQGPLGYPLSGMYTSLVQHMDRWSEANPNPNATYPRLSINKQQNNTQTSTFWLTNAAYLRLKNVQVGWTMPSKWFKKGGIEGIRIFANGTNLFTLDNMHIGMDPESPDTNAHQAFPLLKSFVGGVEIKF